MALLLPQLRMVLRIQIADHDSEARVLVRVNRRCLLGPLLRLWLLGNAERDQDFLLNLVSQLGVIHQELAHILLALAQLVIPVGEPGAGLTHDTGFDTHVDDRAFA